MGLGKKKFIANYSELLLNYPYINDIITTV